MCPELNLYIKIVKGGRVQGANEAFCGPFARLSLAERCNFSLPPQGGPLMQDKLHESPQNFKWAQEKCLSKRKGGREGGKKGASWQKVLRGPWEITS